MRLFCGRQGIRKFGDLSVRRFRVWRIDMKKTTTSQWRDHGIKVVPGSQLDLNTAQTPGMTRAAAITHARTGASKLWAGTVTIERSEERRVGKEWKR